MPEIEKLKIEARQLLEEVNIPLYASKKNYASTCSYKTVYQDSFRSRLNQIRQKLISLKSASPSFPHQ